MKYSEKIEKYAAGELGESETREVEYDIERHEAISDYLAEREDIPELGVTKPTESAGAASPAPADLTKKIRRQIRLSFLKAGLITAACVLGIVFFCMYALPKLIDGAYYDPTEKVAPLMAGDEVSPTMTNRMSLDVSVFSELLLPGKYRCDVFSESLGSGKYAVNVQQNFSHTGVFRDTAGFIDRGKLTLYDPNIFKLPVQNVFDTHASGVGDVSYGDIYDLDYARGSSEGGERYLYVTFDGAKDYDWVLNWCKENGVSPEWGAVCADGEMIFPGLNVGVKLMLNSIIQGFERDRYPYLTVYSIAEQADSDHNAPENIMRQHITSLLRYFADNTRGMDMLYGQSGIDDLAESCRAAADTIEQNGFKIYGISFTADAEKIAELYSNENVVYMFSEALS